MGVQEKVAPPATSKPAAEPEKTAKLQSKRPFRSTTVDPNQQRQNSMTSCDWKMLSFVLVIAAAVRLYGLNWPASVVFDEVHFGKFAKKYIIGRFFFDVHPPLAKMLFAVVGFLGGFDGDTDFDFSQIGDDYIKDHIPYVAMRLFPSLTGLATIALCYATMRASGVRTLLAGFASLLLTFENTFATESRYILLDSPLVCFLALSAYGFKKFENYVPFQFNWYRYLLLTGLGLGATMSSKWVGLFTYGWVGVITVYQLWFILGDLNVSIKNFQKHFAARAVFLIAVPAVFYMAMFYIHFMCADNMGDGANMLPRWFQASLKHNDLPRDVPLNVTFGSMVSIRHIATNGGWLHTHEHNYPEGSQQQQVTLYPFEDDNNLWEIEESDPNNKTGGEIFHDMLIRLIHPGYKRRLHSHDHRPPVTTQEHYNEVSAYGFENFDGDLNDNWRVKIVKSESIGEGKDKLQAMHTVFQLQHVGTGCYLHSKDITLPEWGYGQKEVTCLRDGKGPRTYWTIEHNISPHIPDALTTNYPIPSFWKKFVALNKVMWNVNKGLTESHNWESRPTSWVQLKRGINMWGGGHRHVYLVGNLPIYWTILIASIVFVFYKLVRFLSWYLFDIVDFFPAAGTPLGNFEKHFGNYLLGWWFHLFPSFFMERQLFLHHYLGSLYFGILMIGQLFEYAFEVVKPKVAIKAITGIYLAVAVAWYYWYSPLIYGTKWTQSLCEKSKFFDMDFTCGMYPEEYSAYPSIDHDISESIFSAYNGLAKPTESTEEKPTATPEAEAAPIEEERSTIRAYVNDDGIIENLEGADENVDIKSVQNEVNMQLNQRRLAEEGERRMREANGEVQQEEQPQEQNEQQNADPEAQAQAKAQAQASLEAEAQAQAQAQAQADAEAEARAQAQFDQDQIEEQIRAEQAEVEEQAQQQFMGGNPNDYPNGDFGFDGQAPDEPLLDEEQLRDREEAKRSMQEAEASAEAHRESVRELYKRLERQEELEDMDYFADEDD